MTYIVLRHELVDLFPFNVEFFLTRVLSLAQNGLEEAHFLFAQNSETLA